MKLPDQLVRAALCVLSLCAVSGCRSRLPDDGADGEIRPPDMTDPGDAKVPLDLAHCGPGLVACGSACVDPRSDALVDCLPSGPSPVLFDRILFDLITGADDLRGDSSATVAVTLDSDVETFVLKAQGDPGFGGNQENMILFAIKPPRPQSAFRQFTITLTTHNGPFETQDNWNIDAANVVIETSGRDAKCVFAGRGHPLVRLTGDVPSVTLRAPTGC